MNSEYINKLTEALVQSVDEIKQIPFRFIARIRNDYNVEVLIDDTVLGSANLMEKGVRFIFVNHSKSWNILIKALDKHKIPYELDGGVNNLREIIVSKAYFDFRDYLKEIKQVPNKIKVTKKNVNGDTYLIEFNITNHSNLGYIRDGYVEISDLVMTTMRDLKKWEIPYKYDSDKRCVLVHSSFFDFSDTKDALDEIKQVGNVTPETTFRLYQQAKKELLHTSYARLNDLTGYNGADDAVGRIAPHDKIRQIADDKDEYFPPMHSMLSYFELIPMVDLIKLNLVLTNLLEKARTITEIKQIVRIKAKRAFGPRHVGGVLFIIDDKKCRGSWYDFSKYTDKKSIVRTSGGQVVIDFCTKHNIPFIKSWPNEPDSLVVDIQDIYFDFEDVKEYSELNEIKQVVKIKLRANPKSDGGDDVLLIDTDTEVIECYDFNGNVIISGWRIDGVDDFKEWLKSKKVSFREVLEGGEDPFIIIPFVYCEFPEGYKPNNKTDIPKLNEIKQVQLIQAKRISDNSLSVDDFKYYSGELDYTESGVRVYFYWNDNKNEEEKIVEFEQYLTNRGVPYEMDSINVHNGWVRYISIKLEFFKVSNSLQEIKQIAAKLEVLRDDNSDIKIVVDDINMFGRVDDFDKNIVFSFGGDGYTNILLKFLNNKGIPHTKENKMGFMWIISIPIQFCSITELGREFGDINPELDKDINELTNALVEGLVDKNDHIKQLILDNPNVIGIIRDMAEKDIVGTIQFIRQQALGLTSDNQPSSAGAPSREKVDALFGKEIVDLVLADDVNEIKQVIITPKTTYDLFHSLPPSSMRNEIGWKYKRISVMPGKTMSIEDLVKKLSPEDLKAFYIDLMALKNTLNEIKQIVKAEVYYVKHGGYMVFKNTDPALLANQSIVRDGYILIMSPDIHNPEKQLEKLKIPFEKQGSDVYVSEQFIKIVDRPDTVTPIRVNENFQPKLSRAELVKKFMIYAIKDLKLQKPYPKVKLTKDKSVTKTYAHFDPDANEVVVYVGKRSLGDILRSLGHELVHRKQDQDNKLTANSGETGSPIENEANAYAGVLLRNFGEKYPMIFESKMNEIKQIFQLKTFYDGKDYYIQFNDQELLVTSSIIHDGCYIIHLVPGIEDFLKSKNIPYVINNDNAKNPILYIKKIYFSSNYIDEIKQLSQVTPEIVIALVEKIRKEFDADVYPRLFDKWRNILFKYDALKIQQTTYIQRLPQDKLTALYTEMLTLASECNLNEIKQIIKLDLIKQVKQVVKELKDEVPVICRS